ncbi:type II toxin-antitoxin system VapC family toxin [Agrobacterium rosae]|uniref:type II toxin-antitoxin system VapC family toxin n=1 Tax=Agrobacterium rosae TaxID=1972867 RepID=UPI003B9E3F0C
MPYSYELVPSKSLATKYFDAGSIVLFSAHNGKSIFGKTMLKQDAKFNRRMLLLDTTILSARARKRPPEGLRDWLAEASEVAHLCICFPVLIEIKRGLYLSRDEETKARVLRAIEDIEQSDFFYLGLGRETEDILAQMMATPALKKFWFPNPAQRRQRVSHDLMISAVAITYGTPILTTDGDFAEIDRHFRIPGVYNPMTDRWEVMSVEPIELPVIKGSFTDPTI